VKGVTAAAHIVKPGGAILLVSECAEGAGAAEFSRLLVESPSPAAFLEKIERASVEVDQWQLEKLALVFQNQRVLFYVPGLPAEFRAKLWGPAFESAADAVAALLSILPAEAQVAVLPDGPYVFARPTACAVEPVAV
jgi:nickel-dependent lactate racemase